LDKASQTDVLGHNGRFLGSYGAQAGMPEDDHQVILGDRPIMAKLKCAGGS